MKCYCMERGVLVMSNTSAGRRGQHTNLHNKWLFSLDCTSISSALNKLRDRNERCHSVYVAVCLLTYKFLLSTGIRCGTIPEEVRCGLL
jgi:hypothetical protein